MLLGVISDTHIPERASKIPETVFKTFKDTDMILHAGDLVSYDVLEELESIATTRCVQGNMDRVFGAELPKRDIIEVEGIKIGLNHGEVYPRGDTQQLKYIAREMDVEVLITGHTHWAFIKEVDNILLLNPGSPTVPRLSDPSVMLIEIKDQKLDARIIKIGDPVCKALNFKGRKKS
ncbi:metallophosphoesterase [Methanobacterium paludis]|uniref:Phosphoesterase n=1 Tax=Methanobacterium paludis (strain DSM 25820 / JCM 18151 / SWAN1) TaxID=868131 RepID=F6D5C8_METPW|nr:metallophosphoesterase [Methanobacterium paludis]AEG18869.1 phosphodiesterase, MJ0936 family [Methanobacterium paludis]